MMVPGDAGDGDGNDGPADAGDGNDGTCRCW